MACRLLERDKQSVSQSLPRVTSRRRDSLNDRGAKTRRALEGSHHILVASRSRAYVFRLAAKTLLGMQIE